MTTSDNAAPFETRIVEMAFPNQTNHYGTLFGLMPLGKWTWPRP
jgi:acyl-CoA hydrolase